ncbi:hypothetical protein [Streptomyces benahoarensis]|uniref:recombination directionality factor n=1 Tax=Streptomyces benahoarensis TaxID=2595054 RepID=UPI003D8079FC
MAGNFQFGRVIGNRPVVSPRWRVTTGELHVAERVARVLGGAPEKCGHQGSDSFDLETESPAVLVAIDGPGGISMDMRLWGPRGLTHHCDGVAYLSPEAEKGRPCGCPSSMIERRGSAKSGQGPQPNTTITFRLPGVGDVGDFQFQSSSWKLAETVCELQCALAAVDAPSLCELSLERVEFKTVTGRSVSYFKPVLAVGVSSVMSEI